MSYRMRRCLLTMLCMAATFSVGRAQENKPWAGLGIEANYMAANGFKHSAKMRADLSNYIPGVELNFIQQTDGRKTWHQRRHYPLLGMAVAYTRYDNDSVYGRAVSLYPNLQIPIIRGRKVEWTAKAGFGIAYITKRFERVPGWDTLNTAIGSRMNNYSYFSTDLRYHVNEHLDMQVGVNFAHISNATLRHPNLGINKYGVNVGLRYFPVTSRPERIVKTLPKLKNRVLVQMRLSLAGTEISASNGPMYPVYLASLFASKRYLSKNKLLLGVDYAYYTHVYRFQKNNEINPGKEAQNSWKSSLFIGNEFLFGRVGVVLQVGYYLKHNELSKNKIYEKLGGNIYLIQNEKGILKELSTHAYLKTHGTEAELVEVGLGMGF